MANESDAAASAGGHLRRVLLDAGVTTRWSTRDLQAMSGDRINHEMWARMTRKIPRGKRGSRWAPWILQVAAETLRKAGADVTLRQLEDAANTDFGYLSYRTDLSGDGSVAEVLALIPGLSADDALVVAEELFRQARTAANRQEGSSDEGDVPRPRSR